MADTLGSNGLLAVDQPLHAEGGQVKFVFQSDGNLVLYVRRPNGWLARWASNTAGTSANKCILQDDGNLALLDDIGLVWTSGIQTLFADPIRPVNPGFVSRPGLRPIPQRTGPPRLVVHRDENVVISRGGTPVWATGTSLDGTPIKGESQPEVFSLRGGVRRWIPDPETLEHDFGGWGRVTILAQAQVDQWPLGDPVPSVLPPAAEFNMCFDKQVRAGSPLPPRQYPPSLVRISPDGVLFGSSLQRLTSVTELMWNVGQVLRVKLMGGTPFIRGKVRQYAEEWSKYANIRFQFVDPAESAEIRVAFDSGGSWSLIGREALWMPFDFATMNFGWFSDNTPDSEFSRVVCHEFGHALGFVHEHQSPAAGIQWDREKAYAYFQRTQGWDRGMVDAQVFAKYSVTHTNYSVFDPTSIMEYWIPASITLDGRGVPGNTVLSATDIEFARRWYPTEPTPSHAVGLLRTGDDCDEIEFVVEYGVVADSSQVEFALSPASGLVWWKAIEAPIAASAYRMLEMQDGRSASATIPITTLDPARPLRFWKAKAFGVHTRLNFTWDVIQALPGGSRLSLLWKRDRC